jgi:crossover junction endodeoxyribonuclease RusA
MVAMILTVYGVPGPQGSKRHVGGGRMIESSKKVAPWREAVKWAVTVWRASNLARPLEGPLAVTVVFSLPRPKSAPKRTRAFPAKKPDIDKLVRSTFDALTDGGAWIDDGQVIALTARKVYVGDIDALDAPGAAISVERAA